jgi:uncharacterized protein with HEPN domain
MIDAATDIGHFIEEMTYERFIAGRLISSAVAYQITIIGEASIHVPSAVRDRHPEVPWLDMRAMRNLLAHHYFRLDRSVLWDTATVDIPALIPALQSLSDIECR